MSTSQSTTLTTATTYYNRPFAPLEPRPFPPWGLPVYFITDMAGTPGRAGTAQAAAPVIADVHPGGLLLPLIPLLYRVDLAQARSGEYDTMVPTVGTRAPTSGLAGPGLVG